MGKVGTFLNFANNTEDVFQFYKTVFGGEFTEDGIVRFGLMPAQEGMPPMPDEVKNMVMHVCLPIMGGFNLMGSDAPEMFGMKVVMGNNVYINLEPDTRVETLRLFKALSDGGNVEMDLQDTFWGAYYGSCTDKFGVHWMFNCAEKA